MNEIYDSLPIVGQNLACTFAGFQKARSRYGRHFDQTLTAWRQSIDGPLEALHGLQWKRLHRLIERARRYVPFYAELPEPSRATDPLEAIAETLAAIPMLDKQRYRSNPNEFVARDIPRSRIIQGDTSGTTGTALRVHYSPEALAEEYATVWRLYMAQGLKLKDPYLSFIGSNVVPFSQSEPPFWRTNLWMRQTLFSVYHMMPRNLPSYIDAVHRSRAKYVQGYPSAMHLVARAMLDAGRPLPKGRLMAAFTSSESLLAFQRATIEEAFGVPVWDRYGTGEFAVSMTSCSEQNLHVDMEFCIVEIEVEEETEEYERGALVVTGLSNDATPFIRYRIGDVGTRLKAPCACGRPGDVFLDVDGRNEDYVVTPDGRYVGRLDHIFKKQSDILEAQIRQDSKEAIEVMFVPAASFDESSEKGLVREIRRRLGDEIHIDLVRVVSIPRERNGKFRAVKSKIGQLG